MSISHQYRPLITLLSGNFCRQNPFLPTSERPLADCITAAISLKKWINVRRSNWEIFQCYPECLVIERDNYWAAAFPLCRAINGSRTDRRRANRAFPFSLHKSPTIQAMSIDCRNLEWPQNFISHFSQLFDSILFALFTWCCCRNEMPRAASRRVPGPFSMFYFFVALKSNQSIVLLTVFGSSFSPTLVRRSPFRSIHSPTLAR